MKRLVICKLFHDLESPAALIFASADLGLQALAPIGDSDNPWDGHETLVKIVT